MAAVAAGLLALLAPRRAALAAPGVVVTTSSSTKLTLDSNKPTVEGPHTMYVAFQVRNTTGATLTNLTATISGFT
ncbi:MAG TPA: hypothetical protein VFS11_02085, partial [Gemmatimonadales bacterium]|nr:hypothetical protein [Gemmatimonadales bacterium]